ncbi:META domain-containing protein [Sphingopyxis sp. YF1]|nr:META domain-containing protein [Sphingopyxis sp. YF1]
MPNRMSRLFAAATASALLALSAPATAQTAVPLSRDLFDLSWVVIDFAGQTDAVGTMGAPTLTINDGRSADGQTPCATGWSGTVTMNLPALTISDVEAYYDDKCPLVRETIAFLDGLELVRSARTTDEGLELVSQDGTRLFLLSAGG